MAQPVMLTLYATLTPEDHISPKSIARIPDALHALPGVQEATYKGDDALTLNLRLDPEELLNGFFDSLDEVDLREQVQRYLKEGMFLHDVEDAINDALQPVGLAHVNTSNFSLEAM